MGFPQAIERQQQAVFDRLGEDATWTGAADPVRIRRPRDGDEDFRLDYGELVARGTLLKVRKAQIAAPAEGHEIQILDEDGNAVADAQFVVTGEPKLDRRKGVWTCQVTPAA